MKKKLVLFALLGVVYGENAVNEFTAPTLVIEALAPQRLLSTKEAQEKYVHETLCPALKASSASSSHKTPLKSSPAAWGSPSTCLVFKVLCGADTIKDPSLLKSCANNKWWPSTNVRVQYAKLGTSRIWVPKLVDGLQVRDFFESKTDNLLQTIEHDKKEAETNKAQEKKTKYNTDEKRAQEAQKREMEMVKKMRQKFTSKVREIATEIKNPKNLSLLIEKAIIKDIICAKDTYDPYCTAASSCFIFQTLCSDILAKKTGQVNGCETACTKQGFWAKDLPAALSQFRANKKPNQDSPITELVQILNVSMTFNDKVNRPNG